MTERPLCLQANVPSVMFTVLRTASSLETFPFNDVSLVTQQQQQRMSKEKVSSDSSKQPEPSSAAANKGMQASSTRTSVGPMANEYEKGAASSQEVPWRRGGTGCGHAEADLERRHACAATHQVRTSHQQACQRQSSLGTQPCEQQTLWPLCSVCGAPMNAVDVEEVLAAHIERHQARDDGAQQGPPRSLAEVLSSGACSSCRLHMLPLDQSLGERGAELQGATSVLEARMQALRRSIGL